ncbi:hypothetical protein [Roseateles sp. P5_E7]
MSIRIQTLLAALCGLLAATTAHAQTYRCIVGGTTYLSDRPCAPTNASPARLVAAGATQQTASTTYRSSTPSLQPAPDHHRYLSQRCAEVNDAIRTAPSRGVGRSVVTDLQREYRSHCTEDDAYARERLSEDRNRQREGERHTRQEAAQSRQESQRLQERCIALRDAIRTRRAQGDKATTAEEAYNANCLGR